MTRKTNTCWTEADYQLLGNYAHKGHTAFRIAAALQLQRSVAGVRTMAQRAGVKIQTGHAVRAKLNLRN